MPITFTEEDFVQSPAQPKAGFFSEKDFAPTGKKTREQVMAEVQAAQAQRDLVSPPEQMSGLESVLASPSTEAITQQFANPYRTLAVGLMEPQRLVGGRGGINAPSMIDQSPITPEMVKRVLESPLLSKSMIGSSGPGSGMEGVQNFVSRMTSGLVAPVPLAQMLAGGGLAKMGLPQQGAASVAAGFVPSMVTDVPQAMQGVEEAFSGGSNQQKVEETLRLMTDVVFPMLMMKGAVTPKPVEQSGVRIAENRNPIYDAPKGGDLIGPERQLPAPGERPTSVPGTPMDRPAGGARFGVDPLGKVVDLSQLTPKEQVELYRGPKESVPREQYVRPAQQAPVVIGEQAKPQRPIVFQNETGPIEPVSVPSRRPVESSGGEISFRAPASAQGIPSARQSVVGPKPEIKPPVVFQNETAPAVEAKPEVAKASTSKNKNPLGDPMGTTYYAKPEDWVRWEKVQAEFKDLLGKGVELDGPEMMKVRQENENIKNKYGGMPPVKPKEVIGSEKEIRKEEGVLGGGIVGGAGKAVEKNREAGSVPNPFQPKEEITFSKKLEDEIRYMRETFDESADAGETLSRNQAIRRLLEDYTDKNHWSHEFKKELEDYQIKTGIVKAYTKAQLDNIVTTGGKKYDFRRGDHFYTFEGWKHLKDEEGGGSSVSIKPTNLGEGIGKAVEKNKEAGSVENPFARIVDKFKNKEKEKRGETFALSGPRIALDPKESGFKDVTKKVDAQQLWNRVKNKLTPAERDVYEKSGVDKRLVEMGKVSPEEAAKMLQDSGPEVRVESYGMEGKVSEAKREYDRMTHEWWDTLSQGQRDNIGLLNDAPVEEIAKVLKLRGWSDEQVDTAKKYVTLKQQVEAEPRGTFPRATSAYSQVSAFDTTQPMPDWTATKSGKNVQRVDVVIPQKIKEGSIKWKEGQTIEEGKVPETLWQPDNLHENLPNTLGWAMIQYKDGPKGEKVAVLVEAQSEWGQHVRNESIPQIKDINNLPEGMEIRDDPYPPDSKGLYYKGRRISGGYTKEEILQNWNNEAYGRSQPPNHPLLHDYNRLILKAAIDQARKEGATHIVVSDAKTAMMTEGHDVYAKVDVYDKNGKLLAKAETPEGAKQWEKEADYGYTKPTIDQEPGMRLNYDTILPKIAEELTGSKGERVSLGEHKNAFEGSKPEHREPGFAYDEWKQRSNLIFKNPDGTPKTDVSGIMYPLPKSEKKFSLFEKDRPEQVEGRLYMNPIGPVAKQAVKDIKELGNKVIEGSKLLKEYYKGAPEVKSSGFNPERGQLLPDFQPKEVANKVAATPFGSEKIPVLGRLMGGKARIRTPQDQAVAAWYMERHGVGPAVASSVGEIIRGQVNGVFKVSENGDLNVKPTMPGQSLKMSDVFEGLRKDPLSYELTVPQRKVFKNVIEPITKRMTELGQKYKILDEIVDESGDFKPYFPRIVTKHPKMEDKSPTSQFKSRAFNSEAEGWKRGYEYELDPEKRLVTGIERLYRAIANKRLATDPILGAKSEAQLKSEIKMSYAEKLATGEITQAKIDRIAEGIRTRGQVMQPILVRSIFDPVTAKMLNKEFAAEQSTIRKNITSANSMLKALQLGFDLGVGQIQLLLTLYDRPSQWGKAMVGSMKGMFNPEYLSEYVRQNKEAVSELAQLGSSVGRLQEHMSGLGGEGLLGKTPVVGQVSQAFGRQFQTAMDVAKIELWKALKEGAPKDEWPKLVRAVETLTLSGRSESAMVPHGRALLERVLLLAPSYYRGAIEHIAALGERGASGKAVRRSMSRFILGSAITYYAVATALQMSQDEIAEGFNPANTSFMTWKVKMEDGSVVNVGFGGIFRSFLKLGANITKTSIEHPENWKSLSSEKNPITRWYRGHAGPTIGAAWDGFSGEDFLGRPADLGTLAKGRLPLLAQEALRRPEEPKATPLDFGASTFGLTTTPESFGNKRVRVQEEVAKAKYGKEFKNLGTIQRAQVDKEVEKKLSGVPTGMTKEKSREVAMKMGDEKVKELKEGLSEGVRSWMEEKKMEVGGYQSTRTVGGKQIRLTKEEEERLREIMTAEYEKSLEKLRTHPRIGKMSGEELQRYVNVHLENARKKGWAVMSREIRDNARGEK